MIPLDSTVREEIRRRGRVTFAEFMAWALYHPRGGYYTAGRSPTGRAGDFITNAQVPLFADVLAAQFVEMWDALGSERFTLVELGGGDGVLAERVLRALEARGRRATFHLVEAGSARRETARRRLSRFSHVEVHAGLETLEHTAGVEGCVYANEFFDALPVHRVRWAGGRLWELYVTEREGRLVETPGDPSTPALGEAAAGIDWAEGQEGEINLALAEAVSHIGRVLSRGFVLTVDYGAPARELYGEGRPRGTLRSFQEHRLTDDPFSGIGTQDITAHVDFTRLARRGEREGLTPLVYADQGPYVLAAAEAVVRAAVESPVGPAPAGPGGRAQFRQLIHPSAFGGVFRVLVQGKNVAGVRLAAERVSRLQRLGVGR